MNVVGKVGSLIQQGVYSVATPFHPFGGAVDIIVVQQQDGSYRSTPWYVRFGKFQGVLKGAEKHVHINVNGVETNLHMYLDNSGEAYFGREVDLDLEGEDNGTVKDGTEDVLGDSVIYSDKNHLLGKGNFDRLHSTMSDPGVARESYSSQRPTRLERSESDSVKFYDFQDDESSLDGSVDLHSEYGSSRYENLEGVANCTEGQGSDSEMVLFSVDGHVLTAPISSSEQDNKTVQLDTPQFHLGPGESAEFCEGEVSAEFSVAEDEWATGYVTGLAASSNELKITDKEGSSQRINDNNDGSQEHQSRGCEVTEGTFRDNWAKLKLVGEDERRGEHQEQVTTNFGVAEINRKGLDRSPVTDNTVSETSHVHSDSEDASVSSKNEDHFSSCLKLSDLAFHTSDGDTQGEISPLKVHHDEEQQSPQNFQLYSSEAEILPKNVRFNIEPSYEGRGQLPSGAVESAADVSSVTFNAKEELNYGESGSTCVKLLHSERAYNTDPKDKHVISPLSLTDHHSSSYGEDVKTAGCTNKEILEAKSTKVQADLGSGFDLSICGHLLHPGMGLHAASEAFDQHRISEEEFKNSYSSVIKNDNLVVRRGEYYLLWEKAAPIVLGKAVFGLNLPVETTDAMPLEQDESHKSAENDSRNPSTSSTRYWLWRNPFRRSKTLQHSVSTVSNEDVFVDFESASYSPTLSSQSDSPSTAISKSPRKKLIRSNIPTSEQIAALNLKDGQNMVTFTFSTRVLGQQQVDAHIYLWKWNARIVISDVDGTITKSDVLGQFMPLVGRDWTQSGVARLFCAIKENGYQLLFLSARAIVQAYLTRSFLLNLKQDGKTLPNGPVVISPDGLFPSLYREVIRRAPHEFKIACLEDIKALFPPDYNPFYAGFGNRDTDELSYRKIGIPKGKIFIINPKGEVAISHRIDVKSYTSLHTLVNDMFPPTSMVEQEDYNSWNYWKTPLPDIEE